MFIPATDTSMPGNVANLGRMLTAAEGETGRTPSLPTRGASR